MLELFRFFAELHRLVRRQPLMHVVQQFNLVAQLLSADFQQLQRAPHLIGGIEQRLVVKGLIGRASAVRRTIACHAGQPDLHPDVAKSLCHIFLGCCHYVRELLAVCVRVAIHRLAALASSQLVDRHSCLAPFNVPQRLIDPLNALFSTGPFFQYELS